MQDFLPPGSGQLRTQELQMLTGEKMSPQDRLILDMLQKGAKRQRQRFGLDPQPVRNQQPTLWQDPDQQPELAIPNLNQLLNNIINGRGPDAVGPPLSTDVDK